MSELKDCISWTFWEKEIGIKRGEVWEGEGWGGEGWGGVGEGREVFLVTGDSLHVRYGV